MSRWFFPWSASIKKRASRYLLQHYLGHFLQERLSLEQLSLDLYQGQGGLRDIHLDIWSVNEQLESLGAPLELIDGFIGAISVTIPWSALVTENCTVEVTGLQVTCRPKYRIVAQGSESQTWSSCMTTSMQLAQECLKEQAEELTEPPQPLEGLEMFAQTIETVLRRIKVTFLDTIIRVEHTPDGAEKGVALEVHIKRLDYCDEAVRDPSQVIPVDIHQPPAFVHKILQLSGVVLHYEEFSESKNPTSPVPQEMDSSSCSIQEEAPLFTESRSRTAESSPSSLLQIGSCSGYTEMTIKLKQNEVFPGPKLEIDGKMASLHLLLTPQQLVYLGDLLDALSISEVSRLKEKLNKSRPLDSEDLKLIEQDLSQQLNSLQGPMLPEPELQPFPVMENGEMFFSMAQMTSSVTSIRSVSELSDVDLDSSIHSNYSSGQLQAPSFTPGLILNSPRRYGRSPFAATLPNLQNMNKLPGKASPPLALEALRPEMLLKLTIGGLTLTLLHQYLEGSQPEPQPAQLSQLINHFFTELAYFKDTAFSGRDFQHLRQQFEKAIPCSHLRLTGAAVQVICEQKAGRGVQAVSTDLCFSMLELLECLWPSENHAVGAQQKLEYTEILFFANTSAFHYNPSSRPCARIHYKQSERAPSKTNRRKAVTKRSAELLVELAEFHSDVDLGLVDRLGALLQTYAPAQELLSPQQMHAEQHLIESPPTTEQQMMVKIEAPKAHLRILFPIPDLRPEPERRPWAEKAIRKECLILEFSDVDFQTSSSSTAAVRTDPTKLEFTFSDVHGVYDDGEKPAVSCIRVSKSLDPSSKAMGKKYIFPKIAITIRPQSHSSQWDLLLGKSDDMNLSTIESPCELKQPEPSPFSSKRTMYETEEMVIPGDREEMADFQKSTVAMSQYALEVTVPCAHIFFPSKEYYESIYNRINNDLLMWEPADLLSTALSADGPHSGSSAFYAQLPGSMYRQDNFRMCKSAFKLDSDSEDEDSHFCSVDEAALKRKAELHSQGAQSFFSAQVNILKGRITALCETKGDGGKKLEDSHGELVLDIDNGTIFSVSKYKGQEDLSYLCLESDKVSLYHKAVVEDYFLPEKLEVPNFYPPELLNPIIYLSEDGVISKLSSEKKDKNLRMLSTAIRIDLDLKKNVKEFLVALRLEGATMRHHMALTNQSWYTQLMDFLDVLDDPILGYMPPTVITVLHTHLFSCAVDYRPLYLPVRVLITAETFTLSSNIIVDTATFLLRFILDDSAVYLSDKCGADAVDLRKDYVCVLDVDLLELVITTWKGSDPGKLTQPLFELRCSNNVVHLHTCADSCALLANLIQYVVNNGDLHPPPKQDSPTEIAGQKLQLSESPASLPLCPPAETAEINQRDLTDALIDTERALKDLSSEAGTNLLGQRSPVSEYLFPGEDSNSKRKTPSHPSPPPPATGGDVMDFCPSDLSDGEGEMTDNDDFCILDAPGMGIPPKDGEPIVTKLTEGPISVKDGHFARPLGSTDLLKAPARFPVPETRIMLREISVVWHLYGGRDFGTSRPSSAHSPRMKSGSSSSRGSPSRPSITNRPQNTWRTQGGNGRIHDILMEIQLTKVSFQHETYSATPPSTEKALAERGGTSDLEELPVSRQVFIVQELEIRDRLASSQINKFLYLYTSEKMPRRAHSNMLTIKALHVCPEAGLGGPECCLRVSLMPLRLNIDQDALFFLKDFFSSLAAGINPVIPLEIGTEARPDSLHRDAESTGQETDAAPSSVVSGADMSASMETTVSDNSSASTSSSSTEQPIYFREFRFTSEVPIWLDYQGKHVTMDQVGTFAGILIGLAQLNCSELKLKRLCCRHGLLGVDKVTSYALNEWLTDIRKNQLPGILGGVGPMHSVVQLFHGLRDLFWMPIEQYRKDGRIIRGLQRGAASFGTSTASAALELSNRLVQAIQATAETVYDILSPTPPVTRVLMDKKYARKLKRSKQPADLREGVAKAYDTVREGVIDTAQAICDVAARGHEQKGIPGAVGGVLRQIPPTVVKPLIVASEATSNLLGGMRNQIKPDARKEEYLKWRSDENQE
ncbi:autophagy-related protein 2 homolog A [Ambystoma mexicanum]|uniref:autophagy-related protein 2 homolog A n=1 Tax=Ambystoma mexicanum TaxID=8296 RepID=UPI0037E76F6F